MGKVTKGNNNIYRRARIKAACFNEKFKSREGASEILGVSKDSMNNYELGQCKQVPVDIVIKMADVYHSPELMNDYCCNECPLGKFTVSPVNLENINNIYKLGISIFNCLSEGHQIGKRLLDIVEDGKITEDETPTATYIVDVLESLSRLKNELIIAIENQKVKEMNRL